MENACKRTFQSATSPGSVNWFRHMDFSNVTSMLVGELAAARQRSILYARRQLRFASPDQRRIVFGFWIGRQTLRLRRVNRLVELWRRTLPVGASLELLHGHHYNCSKPHNSNHFALYTYPRDIAKSLACYLTLGEGITSLIEQPLFSRRPIMMAPSLHLVGWINERAPSSCKAKMEAASSVVRTRPAKDR